MKEQTAVLCLTLHREFFDAILAGKKKTEYRENKEYWRRRLIGRTYEEVHFRNGYATNAPFMRVQCKGLRKVRRGGKIQFAIRLGKILELRHYRSL
jgi:ASC-1-like (ASCH) protein